MLRQLIKKIFLIQIIQNLIKTQTSTEKMEDPQNKAEYVLLEDLEIKSPLENESKLKRAIFRMVCRW